MNRVSNKKTFPKRNFMFYGDVASAQPAGVAVLPDDLVNKHLLTGVVTALGHWQIEGAVYRHRIAKFHDCHRVITVYENGDDAGKSDTVYLCNTALHRTLLAKSLINLKSDADLVIKEYWRGDLPKIGDYCDDLPMFETITVRLKHVAGECRKFSKDVNYPEIAESIRATYKNVAVHNSFFEDYFVQVGGSIYRIEWLEYELPRNKRNPKHVPCGLIGYNTKIIIDKMSGIFYNLCLTQDGTNNCNMAPEKFMRILAGGEYVQVEGQ